MRYSVQRLSESMIVRIVTDRTLPGDKCGLVSGIGLEDISPEDARLLHGLEGVSSRVTYVSVGGNFVNLHLDGWDEPLVESVAESAVDLLYEIFDPQGEHIKDESLRLRAPRAQAFLDY